MNELKTVPLDQGKSAVGVAVAGNKLGLPYTTTLLISVHCHTGWQGTADATRALGTVGRSVVGFAGTVRHAATHLVRGQIGEARRADLGWLHITGVFRTVALLRACKTLAFPGCSPALSLGLGLLPS